VVEPIDFENDGERDKVHEECPDEDVEYGIPAIVINLHGSIVDLADAVGLAHIVIIVRTDDEVERIDDDPADAAAEHDPILNLQPPEVGVVQPIDEDAQGDEDEGIDDCRVHDQRDEFGSGVHRHVLGGGAGDQQDDCRPDHQSRVIVNFEGQYKFK
jgi:hypothetical protein